MQINDTIFVSTVAFSGKPIEQIINSCKKHKWNLEFSSGLPFREDMSTVYNNAVLKRMPHNYFPAPEDPFVINLASADRTILERSIEHCKQGLKMAKESNSPFFAAHAGFCIDPNPAELGKKIKYETSFDREKHKAIFITSVQEILQFAEVLDIDFLIENNVLAPFNYSDKNPLFCCEYEDIQWLFQEIENKRLGLLLDTAHLKVSCTTLNKDLHSEFSKLTPYIHALHHSDNDGTHDSNDSIAEGYWFLKFKDQFRNVVQVLEVKNISEDQVEYQLNLLQNSGT